MQILNWSELSLPYDFIWKAVIHHMNHIEYECLEFVAIWLFWFHEVTLFIYVWDLLLYYVDWHVCICDLL